jgi:hypothetical protein
MINVIKSFFSQLELEKVPYVQWKSNEHLHEFMEGKSDLDILCYPDDKKTVEDILFRIGARKFEALPMGKYPNIEDYLAADPETGRLVHFHMHFQLDIGETDVKRYPLPWLDLIIENRIKHESVPVWIPSHEHELLLLIIRESLRIHPLKVLFFPSFHRIEKKSFSEFRWLQERIKREDFENAISLFFKNETVAKKRLLEIYDKGLTESSVRTLWTELAPLRKQYRTSGDIPTVLFLIRNRFSKKWVFLLRRFGILIPQKRIYSKGGLIVAITGSDGSGKTTTVENLVDIYGRKLDVEKLYLGMPKPQKSSYPFLVKMIYKLRLKKLWNLYVKVVTLRKACRLREKGILVLCDRFPQAQFPGMMDGPLATDWVDSKNPVKKWFAGFEKRLFQSMQETDSDLVIKLQVDSQTSHRRGGLPVELAEKKTKIVKESVYPKAGNIVTIDTVKYGVDDVLRNSVNEIWEAYKKKHETN